MKHLLTHRLAGRALALALAAALAPAAHADRADRNQPMTITADAQSTIDLLKQTVVFSGNVLISQGTLTIRAERVEVRENAQGFRSATALGSGGRQASFRQKREGLDEYVEGFADRVEYDGQADTVHFIGHAKVRRLRGGTVADELTGDQISYDNVAELFSVQGGPSNVSPGNPSGRVRAVLTPAPKASAPAAPASAAPLKPSGSLGTPR
ncbi:MAG: lipopolysaccharide transport periplasmic protein LptA [Pseudomonadota bacterium]